MSGFTVASSPSPSASKDESDDGSAVMSLISMMMVARLVMMRCLLDALTPLSLVTKRGSSFEMRVVILIEGGIV